MGDEEIESICRVALQGESALGKHPLSVIHDLITALCDTKREFNNIYFRCHQWLFEHRKEIPFSISAPNSKGDRAIDEEIDLKVKLYSQTPIKMNRHVTVYPSIQECLEYKQKLIDQAKNVKE